MLKKRGRRTLSLILTLVMIFSVQILPMWANGSAEIASISGGEMISSNGIYKIADGASGVITIGQGVTDVTLQGNGVSWDGSTLEAEPFTDLQIDCTAAQGISLTLQDVYLKNTSSSDQKPAVDFAGSGNKMLLSGTNMIEKEGSGQGNYAGIHVSQGTELTVSGEGTLYFYKASGAAGLGGNKGELNGDITFGEIGKEGPVIFAKGTKQGALIGSGTGAASADAPGSVIFNAGIYNLTSSSRGGVIGGSAGSAGASAGTKVYFNGGSVNINVDFTGSAVGGGGYDSGNDAAGGNAYFAGGSVRVYVDKNAAGNTSWGTMSEGVCDVAITAIKQNNATDAQNVYKCIFDTLQLDTAAKSFDVKVDGTDFFSGSLHQYKYVQEALDKDEQLTITSTPSNWIAGDDTNLYFYLTGEDHDITVNGQTFKAVFNESAVGTDAEHTTGPFTIEKSAAEDDEMIDTSWYNTSDTSFTVSDAKQLAGLAAIVNGSAQGLEKDDFRDKTITLGKSIDLSGYAEWTPAGSADSAFAGTFDGAGNKIEGLKISDASGGYKGLFGNVTGTVKDFSISGTIGTADSPITAGTDNIGGAAGYNNGTVSGIDGNVSIYINSTAIYAIGGIVGQNGEAGKIENCRNTADILATKVLGGIAGRNYGVIVSCCNTGNITGNGGGKDGVGGIVGLAGNKSGSYNNSVLSCYNTGTISNTGGRWHGGIAGMADSASTIKNCYDIGVISTGFSWDWNPVIGHVDSAYSTVSENYSLEGLNAGDTTESTIPLTIGIIKSAEQMKAPEMIELLNGEDGTVWTADDGESPVNNGYPILSWQAASKPATVQITFDTIPENASIVVKDSAGNAVEPVEAGGKIYDLKKGETYTYVVSASGYTSVSDQITVDETATVSTVLNSSGSGSGGTGGSTGTGNVNASVWDGKSIDVSWYDPDKTDYYISTPADLAGLAAIVNGIYNKEIDTFAGNTKYIVDSRGYSSGSGPNGNNQSTPDYHYGADNFEGKTVHLTADIDMSGGNYMPIGGQYLMTDEDTATRIDASFCGAFDGGGHTVFIECDRHCSKNFGDGTSIGLIGRLGVHDNEASMAPSGAAVYDVVVRGSVRGNRSVGGIVGKIGKNAGDALIENCANFAEVTGTDAKGTGGICGSAYNGGEIRNCYNAGEVSNSRSTYGGIAGSNEIKLTNCYNVGKVSGAGTAPGIATHEGGSYENCYWLDTSADTGLYGGSSDQVIAKTSAEMKTDEFLALLGSAFAKDTKNINNGYPVLSFQSGGSASGGSGGGVVGEVDSKIIVNAGTQGTVSVAPAEVKSGDKVTVTVKPNTGYMVDSVKVTDEDGKAIEVKDNGNGTYTFTMPSGKVNVSVTYKEDPEAQNPASGKFTDVADNAWYSDAVSYVVNKGYFKGTADTLFSPQGTMTRAMFATVVGRMAEIDESQYSGSAFSDVPEGQWYSAYIKWASENGIVSGVGGGKFNPNAEITREQMAAMMYRYAKYSGADLTSAAATDDTAFSAFADKTSVSEYAKDAMIWATAKGIINGTGTGLSPKNDATRAQVAQIIMNYAQKA